MLLRLKSADRKSLTKEFHSLRDEYRKELANAKRRDESRRKGSQTLDGLSRLRPAEFEQYIGGLLEARGYQKVTVRGAPGDQGADILAEIMGDQVAIQCKLCKGTVGDGAVRDLPGAIELTDSTRGLLVTTGMFSIPAQKTARGTSVELINGSQLVEWIAEIEET